MRIAASLGQLASAALLSFVAYHTTCAAHDLDYHDSFASRINWKKVEPYVGADAFVRKMRYKDEPTHPFQENLDTFQPFVGVKLNKYFGVEVGYQRSEEGTKERFFNQNESPQFFGGVPMRLNDPLWSANFDLNTTTKIKGWNFGVMGFYPICKDRTELFAKLGYSKLDLDTDYRFDTRVSNPAGAFPDLGEIEHGALHDKAGILNATLGIKHAFFHNIGGRAFVSYERTSRLHLHSSSDFFDRLDAFVTDPAGINGAGINRTDIINVRAHSSWSLGVGLYYM